MPRIRTGYSFRQAAGKIEDVLYRLLECKYPAAPITDRASAFGWVRWSALCHKQNIKPVFGVELAVTDSWQAKKPTVDHWTFIARDSLQPLNELINLATQQFRYEPLLTYQQATARDDVFIITGHRSQLDKFRPRHGLFVSLGPSSSKGYIRKALELGHELIACSDNRYVLPGDLSFYEVLCGRNASTQSYDQHIQTWFEWASSTGHLGNIDREAAMSNRDYVLKLSNATLQQAELLHPERPATLLDMCLAGAAEIGCDLSDPVYSQRLERELALIEEKKYADYFYIVADICQWARRQMLVGPARGSSCGSLVCYLLKITTVDPIPYDLIFERFIDINRDDLPDIDIDFSDQQRHLVFEYVNQKYGADRVARLGTVAMFKPRSALAEAGAALRVPKWKCDAVAESLLERSSGDARALYTLEDTMMTMPAGQDLLREYPEMRIAARMEGHPRHYSQHAAGIVIAERPILDYIPVDHRTGATMCDKKDAEDLNLLKIDALGLTQLSVFEDCLHMAGLPYSTLDDMPMEDPAAFAILNDGKFSGIFQFNGLALQSIVKQFNVTCFDDIVSVTALARPGPLASGGAHEWVRRKNGAKPVTFPHPLFEPYLKDTLGIVLYQEQVMQIGRNIGDLSWGQVTALRKAMSKSLGVEYFNQFGDPWKSAAIAKGVDAKDAQKVWDDLCAYGSWSFNKSHSVAYGIISYQCCWLKAHYPFEFAAATLSHEHDPAKQIQLLREMSAEGYDYVPIDPDVSTDKWSVGSKDDKRVLVGPLHNIKGIGPKLVNTIIGARARGEPLPDRAKKLLSNPQTPIDSLWPIRDAFRRVMPDPTERNIYTNPTPIINLQIEESDYTALVFCTFSRINPRDENEAVKIARRGYETKDGNTASLNLQLTDDTDTIFGKISRWKYQQLGKPIVDHGRPKKCLYAVKGKIKAGGNFRMMMIENVRYIGDIDEQPAKKEAAE